ncbi:RND family efflux transporter MFP subunit [Pseudomonas savastanoi pv. fraxini]|nr:RND family efflux transporter MFP subunit [Pseudomonas savastanoi pv. fraxini]RMR67244.1 RND family efflux transporter MFP subunit [Pseudomonas savastanoi pv. fraxini]RMR69472.1 RND family efflux transporter MFP subunit [Pseudomonas savastanoi pv. fraxini]
MHIEIPMLRHRFVLLALASVLPAVLTGCNEKTPADPRTDAPLVRVASLQEAGLEPRSFTGTVAARVQSDLGFRVSGKVLERFVDTGQAVKRGQPLMRIDPADLKLAANAQREAVNAARAQAKQAADEEIRYRSLRSSGAISASSYDQIKSTADSAKLDSVQPKRRQKLLSMQLATQTLWRMPTALSWKPSLSPDRSSVQGKPWYGWHTPDRVKRLFNFRKTCAPVSVLPPRPRCSAIRTSTPQHGCDSCRTLRTVRPAPLKLAGYSRARWQMPHWAPPSP